MPTTTDRRTPALADLPKAHLHLHLDGSYPAEAVARLAARRGVEFGVPSDFPDVWSFFDAFGEVPALVESHEDLAMLCRALVLAEAAEGVVYLEPAIEPQLYAPRLGPLPQVTRTILQALAEGAADAGIEVGANLTVNTDIDVDVAVEIARIAVAHAGAGVTAFGTACFDEPLDLGDFREAAAIARAAGLQVVSHAGQTGGPDRVEAVIDQLGATRISHGFRAIESEPLVDRLAADRIVLDVCPVSNVRLKVVPDVSRHPAPLLQAAGVPVTLNADDPLLFGRSITDQYEIARTTWGLDDERLSAFARAGALVPGMSSTTRSRLLAGIDRWTTKEIA